MATKTCPYCAEEIKTEAIRCRYCHAWLEKPPLWSGLSSKFGSWSDIGPEKGGMSRPLRRPAEGRMVAGVCAAFARWMDLDPTIIRVIYATATVFTLGVPGVLLYLLLVLVIPSDDDRGDR